MREIGPKTEARINRMRRVLAALPPEKKRRLAEATQWRTGSLGEPGGRRCVVGHLVSDIPWEREGNHVPSNWHREACFLPWTSQLAADFDLLCMRIGLAATVALVKDAVGALK